MGFLCEFCGEQRSIVYCQSDAASLCLSCDRNVHSANALSRRHSRTLVCERCNSQPAFVRCIEEKISLCQNCDWMGHAGSNINLSHKKQAVNCYSGCPSASELSANWGFLLDLPTVEDSTCEQGMSSTSITGKRPTDGEGPQGENNPKDATFWGEDMDPHNVGFDKSTILMESLTPLLDTRPNVDTPAGCTSSAVPKVAIIV